MSDLAPPLDADLTGTTPTTLDEPAQPWQITDDSEANWALRKIRRAEDRIADRESLYRRERDRLEGELLLLENWWQDITAQDRRTIANMDAYLVGYTMRLVDEDPTFTSRKLPAGKLRRVRGSTVTDVTDVDAFAAWAKDRYPELVRTKTVVEVDKQALKAEQTIGVHDGRFVDALTGEVVPGVVQVKHEDRYKIETERPL